MTCEPRFWTQIFGWNVVLFGAVWTYEIEINEGCLAWERVRGFEVNFSACHESFGRLAIALKVYATEQLKMQAGSNKRTAFRHFTAFPVIAQFFLTVLTPLHGVCAFHLLLVKSRNLRNPRLAKLPVHSRPLCFAFIRLKSVSIRASIAELSLDPSLHSRRHLHATLLLLAFA
jgi:hypothetical protein